MTFKLAPHPDRAAALIEMHARPFELISTPRTVLHFTFMEQGDSSIRAANFEKWCKKQNIDTSAIGEKYHAVEFKDYRLSWENHLEFISFTWDCPYKEDAGSKLYKLAQTQLAEILNDDSKLVSVVQLSITQHKENDTFDLTRFNQQSLSMSKVRDDRAAIFIRHKVADQYGTVIANFRH